MKAPTRTPAGIEQPSIQPNTHPHPSFLPSSGDQDKRLVLLIDDAPETKHGWLLDQIESNFSTSRGRNPLGSGVRPCQPAGTELCPIRLKKRRPLQHRNRPIDSAWHTFLSPRPGHSGPDLSRAESSRIGTQYCCSDSSACCCSGSRIADSADYCSTTRRGSQPSSTRPLPAGKSSGGTYVFPSRASVPVTARFSP